MDQYDKGHMNGYRKGIETALKALSDSANLEYLEVRLESIKKGVQDLDHSGVNARSEGL